MKKMLLVLLISGAPVLGYETTPSYSFVAELATPTGLGGGARIKSLNCFLGLGGYSSLLYTGFKVEGGIMDIYSWGGVFSYDRHFKSLSEIKGYSDPSMEFSLTKVIWISDESLKLVGRFGVFSVNQNNETNAILFFPSFGISIARNLTLTTRTRSEDGDKSRQVHVKPRLSDKK